MLRMVVSTNAEGAAKYYAEALSVGDYYTEGQSCQGLWRGRGSWQLGLTGQDKTGEVTREQFREVALNIHPTEGGPLTERTVDNRRVGYDINFHAPKSLSVLYGLTGDHRLLDAFSSSVKDTMDQMEAEMKCRVRVGGAQTDRTVGNLCWAEFFHFTARPVNGWPDPHLHAHCFTFNAVYDGIEQKWKAGQFGDLKRDAPYFQACFHGRLTSNLAKLGYDVERRGKSWELVAVPQLVVNLFSRRTAEIEAKAEELGIHDAERKSELGARTRSRKNDALPLEQLRTKWASLVTPECLETMAHRPREGYGRFLRGIECSARNAVNLAIATTFERESVVSERQLLATAISHALGAVSQKDLEKQIREDKRFIRHEINGVPMITTKEVMAEEQRMIAFARDGRGTRNPIAPNHVIQDKQLNDQQRAAVRDLLSSTDRVQLVRGGAGSGKTTLMTETVEAMKAALLQSVPVVLLAPSADASRGVLRSEGFRHADTVAKFLLSEDLQKQAARRIIWVDEAGLLGTRTMAALCNAAERLDARVILSGDRGQHRSVERGDPIGLLEKYAGITPISVEKVVRQSGLYRTAVEHLVQGRTERGFDGLQKLGCVRELTEAIAHKEIAFNFANAVELGRKALVVSPTHDEGARVTNEIRDELKRRGIVKQAGKLFDIFEDLRLTDGEKRRANRYENGEVIKFHQNVRGFKAGVAYQVIGKESGSSTVMLNNFRILPVNKPDSFTVYRRHEKATEICVGDTIRITANGKTSAHTKHPLTGCRPKALNNGAIYKVSGFTAFGDIKLENGWKVDKDFGHITHGYCSTSHSSQGKTVDVVFIAQSENSFGATSAQQFYVSVSRGKRECYIYTDDVEGLKRRIHETCERTSAVELSNDVRKSVAAQRESMALENARRIEEERAFEWHGLTGPRINRRGEREGRECAKQTH